MAGFLTDEWIDDLAAAAAGATAVPADVELSIRQVITGTPGGEIRYVVAVSGGSVQVRRGDDPRADVTFTHDRETAAAIHRGELDAQEAFMTGRLEVTGDVQRLMRHAAALAALDEAFAEVRARTTY